MRPQAPTAEMTAEPSLGPVLGCERIAAGPRAALIRVTLAAQGAADVAGAQLVVVDHGKLARCDALPSPGGAGLERVTVGFAVTATATPLGLVVGDRAIALADPCALREVEHELEATKARLRASHDAYASVAEARAETMRAAARAEVAAHDAIARADELQRRLEPAGRHPRGAERRRPGAAIVRRGRPAAAGDASHDEQAASRPRGGRRLAIAACALGPAAVIVVILAWPAGKADENGIGRLPSAKASAQRPRGDRGPAVDALALRLRIPAHYLRLYRTAAKRYGLDWTRLAAVGAIESSHGQAQIAGVVTGTNADGASGPAQFLEATWERFGLDGNADGKRDAHDPSDAIPAMASYLRASGAPDDWRAALRSYNHSDAYVDAVEELAASLRSNAT